MDQEANAARVTELRVSRRGITRRSFMKRATGAGLAGLVTSLPTTSSHATTSEMHMYLAVWQNPGGVRIPWRSRRPRDLAESLGYMINRYIVSHGGWWSPSLWSFPGTIVGHATLFIEMVYASGITEFLVFSNTGKRGKTDAGLYVGRGHAKNPYSSWAFVMAVFYLDELLAGHVNHGIWQSLGDYKDRVNEAMALDIPPRVYRRVLSGGHAEDTFSRLRQIYFATRDSNGIGAPRHFGLNTLEVRRVDRGSNSRSKWHPRQRMTSYTIGGSRHEIHGGCANAIASVLRAIGHGDLVPRTAQISLSLDLDRFHNSVLPVLGSSDAFTSSGRDNREYSELTRALGALPEQFGSGDQIRFVDPNYWYDQINMNRALLAHFLNGVRSCPAVSSAYVRTF